MTDQLATIEKVFILQNVELFSNAVPEALLRLANIARETEFSKGETVLTEGEAGDSFYIVVRGSVKLESRKEQHTEEAAEHQAFGIYSVLEGGSHRYTAVCQEDSILLRVDAEDFFDQVADDVEMVKGIIGYLAKQVRRKAVI